MPDKTTEKNAEQRSRYTIPLAIVTVGHFMALYSVYRYGFRLTSILGVALLVEMVAVAHLVWHSPEIAIGDT